MPKIKTKKLFPKEVRERYNLKSSYDLEDIFELFFKLTLIWLSGLFRGGNRQEKKAHPLPAAPPADLPAQEKGGNGRLQNHTLRRHVAQAQTYQAEMARLAQEATSPLIAERWRDLAEHIAGWSSSLILLAERVDAYQNNAIIQADLKRVPQAIAELEAQIATEEDALVQRELARTLANRRQQAEVLARLQRTMRLAEVKIESTVSLIGTLYSQALVSQSGDEVGSYRRLLAELDEEALTLQDYVAALEEIKLAG
jgi:hypothetical protein